MADTGSAAMTEKQRVKAITDKLEEGLKELFESENYKRYLSTMSKFHNYSLNNTLLIALQKPEATMVAGYQAWQKKFNRYVKKGEKAIHILAPIMRKVKKEQGDAEGGDDVAQQDDETEVKIPAFRVVSVFDISSTEGEPIPEIGVKELLSTVDGYEDFKQAIVTVAPVPVSFENVEGESKGHFDRLAGRIVIKAGMSESQTLKTLVHEVAHSILHGKDAAEPEKDRNTKEVEAEGVAFTVCSHFGIDTSNYSFGYLASWSSGREMKELRSSLDTIRKTASELITGIEEQLKKIRDGSKISIFNIRMNGGERWFKNTSGLGVDGLCKVYAECEKPFVEMGKYGEQIEAADHAYIEQGENLDFSLEFDEEEDQITIFDGENLEYKGLRETIGRGTEVPVVFEGANSDAEVVQNNPLDLEWVENQTFEVCMAAVKKSPVAIIFVRDPEMRKQIEAATKAQASAMSVFS